MLSCPTCGRELAPGEAPCSHRAAPTEPTTTLVHDPDPTARRQVRAVDAIRVLAAYVLLLVGVVGQWGTAVGGVGIGLTRAAMALALLAPLVDLAARPDPVGGSFTTWRLLVVRVVLVAPGTLLALKAMVDLFRSEQRGTGAVFLFLGCLVAAGGTSRSAGGAHAGGWRILARVLFLASWPWWVLAGLPYLEHLHRASWHLGILLWDLFLALAGLSPVVTAMWLLVRSMRPGRSGWSAAVAVGPALLVWLLAMELYRVVTGGAGPYSGTIAPGWDMVTYALSAFAMVGAGVVALLAPSLAPRLAPGGGAGPGPVGVPTARAALTWASLSYVHELVVAGYYFTLGVAAGHGAVSIGGGTALGWVARTLLGLVLAVVAGQALGRGVRQGRTIALGYAITMSVVNGVALAERWTTPTPGMAGAVMAPIVVAVALLAAPAWGAVTGPVCEPSAAWAPGRRRLTVGSRAVLRAVCGVSRDGRAAKRPSGRQP